MKSLKAGVIGLGILGAQHVEFLAGRKEVDIAAVADVRKSRADDVAGKFGAEAYSDYRRMLTEQKLDVVTVATPDPLHCEPVLAVIEAGVPSIILEKPMATTMADAEKMFDAAEKSGTKIYINFANRGSAPDRATYYVIQNGLLGRMVYADVHLDDNILVPTVMWGDRTKEWASGSSTAHFLLSHVTDFLRWVFSPAEVVEVYAIAQQEVLKYTPDLYDAYLTFSNGIKVRAKAEWIRHIDGLVEFGFSFSGSEGTMVYIKRAGFGETDGWRANLSGSLSSGQLLDHQEKLHARGIDVKALVHRPKAVSGVLEAGGPDQKMALEITDLDMDFWLVAGSFVEAIVEDTLQPRSWKGYGPLPSAVDGLRQTEVVCGVIESAASGKVISLSR